MSHSILGALRMRTRRVIGAMILSVAAGSAAVLTVPALAETDARSRPAPAAAPSISSGPASALVDVMSRDLGISPSAAADRLKTEAAAEQDAALRVGIGEPFAGAWFSAERGRVVVAVADPSAAQRARSLGAEPQIVERSERQLESAQRRLDKVVNPPRSVAGWYVDAKTNTVTILARAGSERTARGFAKRAGLPGKAVRVQSVAADFTALFDVRGGDAFLIDRSARCSVGFAVTTGFVSAGHCGRKGATTAGFNRSAQGTFRASQFGNRGGNDYSVIDVNRQWTPKPVVKTTGGDVAVAGSKEALVGASVCRTGSTTGTRCGTITARNATLNVSGRTVRNFIVTSACAQPGDSGGSLMAGNQAQGVLSGGSGSCAGGRAQTVYQPINPVLTAEKLTLVTTDKGTPTTPAKPPATPTVKPTAKPTPTTSPRPTRPSRPAPKPSGASQKFEAEVASLVNKERAKAGCKALNTDARLVKAARGHSQDMATNNFFAHTNRQGISSAQRVLNAGYNWQRTGENIAAGQRTPAEVMTAWMNSSGHRANILNCAFRDLGVGVATRGTTTFWTQDFGTLR
ncbi:CAP domain-containing protein [Actinoplanes sp. NPDC049118]|uniref:CAP domain-containing protein n=1 Tax=Actinoplanes sp. NPDC049118 TaxID=3155769 RepID=UPI0033E81492